MLVAPLWGFSLSLCVSPPLAYTRPGACVSVLTEPQTHLSRCFVASTLVHAPPQPCAHLLPPLPPPNSSHLAHSQANLAVDVRGKPAIGEMGGVEALLQVPPHGKGGGGGTKPGGALPLYRCCSTAGRTVQCPLHCTMQCTVYRHGRCCRMPIPTRRHRSRAALPTCCWTTPAEVGSSRMRGGCGCYCSRRGIGGEGGGGGRGALSPNPNPNPNPLLLLVQVASTDETVQESAVRRRPRTPPSCPSGLIN